MSQPITDLLVADHRRIQDLLEQARHGDTAAYEHFRGALLRHIGLEEKLLVPALVAALGRAPNVVRQLRLDHAAFAALLVPTPTPAVLARITALLALHDPLEEGEQGLYRLADELLGEGVVALVERMRSVGEPPLARHFDGPRAFAAIDALVAKAMADRER